MLSFTHKPVWLSLILPSLTLALFCNCCLSLEYPVGDLTRNYQVDQLDLVALIDQWLHPGSSDEGLVAHWQLNETEGIIAADRVGGLLEPEGGRGFDGILENNPQWQSGKGKLGGALHFQGTGDYVGVAYDPNLNPVDFSVSFWVKPSENAGEFRTPIASTAVATEPELFVTGYALFITINKKLQFFTGVGPKSEGHWHVLGLMNIDRAVWTHVAATFESTSGPNAYGGYTGIKKLYLNGVEVASDTQAKYIPNRSEELTIGKVSYEDDLYLEGLMDDVRLYHRALDPNEVEAIASLGTSVPGGADFNGVGGVSLPDYATLLSHWEDSVKPIVINEVMARNDNYLADPQGEFDDWVELYNAGVEPIDVGGMYLTDNLSDPMKWQIPLGQPAYTTIDPGNYLVIWADEDVLDAGFHANFQLNADEGEILGLYDTDGMTLLDVLSFGPQATDISFGRLPDSTDNLQYMTSPSLGVQNTGPGYSGIVADTTFTFDRGVYTSPSLLEIDCATEGSTIMYTTDGRSPSFSPSYGTVYDPQPLWAPTEGKLDGSLGFDLAHNETKVPYHADLNRPSFTVSFWSRLDANLSLSSCPVASVDTGDTSNMIIRGFMILVTPYETWQYLTGTGDAGDGYWDVMEGPSVPVGSWVHVTATFEATSGPDVDGRYTGVKKLYIDGTEAASNPSASYIPNTKAAMAFGEASYELDGFYFYGLLDDIHIYDRALVDTEVADLANLQPGSTNGLAGHWKLDEEEGWDVSDETGNHDGRMFPGLIIYRTTILRAAAFKTDWLTQDIDTQSYIFPSSVLYQSDSTVPASAAWGHAGQDWEMDTQVTNSGPFTDLNGESFSMIDAMMSAPSLSLVMNWNDMFGPDGQGIYIQGEGVERVTSAELLFPQDSPEEACQIDCVVQIVGGTSPNRWKMDKLSMRLKFKEFSKTGIPTGGPPKLRYKFFPDSDVDRFDTLVLDARMNMTWAYGGSVSVNPSCGGSEPQRPWAQYTRDQFPGDIQNAMGGYAPHGRPVHLYINGVYWGMYLVHERPDATFAASYLGGEKEDYDVLKHNSGWVVGMDDDPTGASIARSNYSALATVGNQVASNPTQANYENVLAWLDLDRFIDYMLVNFFIGNTDWAHQNWYASRNRVDPAGRWRYHNWDPEHSLKCVYDDVTNKDNGDGSPTDLHQDLLATSEYRLRFADRIHQHFFNGGVLTLDGVRDLYLQRLLRVDRAVVGESARWGDNQIDKPFYTLYSRNFHWINEKNRLMDDYFVQRARRPGIDDGIVLGQLRNRSLYPSVSAPVFYIGGMYQHGGQVFEGNNELTMDNPNGSGTIYYTLDGTDPREYWTGNVRGVAYTGPISLTQSSHVKARVLQSGTWSALNEAMYGMGPVAENLRITEIMYHPADPNIGSYPSEDFEFIELKNIGATAINPAFAAFTKGIQFTFPVPQPNTLWDTGFDSDAEGFTYADDPFNGTSNPSYAQGSYEPIGGATGGGLRVYLGPGPTGGATSGGWSKSFDLAEASGVNLSLNYRMIMSEEYEEDEYSEALLELDGTRYGNGGEDYLVHRSGGAYTDATLVVTEAYTGSDWIEIQNVSGGPLDTTGWIVALSSTASINTVLSGTWYLPSSIATDQVLFASENIGHPGASYYWPVNIPWGTAGDGWVMIVDDQGQIVDILFWGYSESEIQSFNVTVNSFAITLGGAWTGAGIPYDGISSNTYQRIGDSDNNDASDFTRGEASQGIQNTGLTVPWGGGGDTGWQTASFSIPQLAAGPHTLTIGGFNNNATDGDEDTEIFIDDIVIDIILSAASLGPGDYTVIVSNREAFESLYGTGVDIAGEYTGFLLDNDGEEIVLEDALGTEIHSFEYEDGWYDITDGGGFSLTLVDPNSTDPNDWDRRSGWRISYAWGGSPGWDDSGLQLAKDSVVINEVLSHSPAGGDWIELHNTTDNPIPIGGWFLSDNDNDLKKYEIEPGLVLASHGYVVFYEDPNFGSGNDPGMHTPFALNKFEDTVYLTSGLGGEITGLYITDEPFDAADPNVAFGRYVKSALAGRTANFVAMSENTPRAENAYPVVGPIVINEIAYHPDTGDAEFVELLNISNETVKLYDEDEQEPWRFVDEPDEDERELEFYFPDTPPIELEPGEYLLLVKDKALVEFVFNNSQPFPAELQVLEWENKSLDNSDERPELQKPGGMINEVEQAYIRVDRVSYKDDPPWPWRPDNSNVYTLQRKVASEYGNDVINWDWDDPYPTHTAGVANPNP